jgi:hypothetical protein
MFTATPKLYAVSFLDDYFGQRLQFWIVVTGYHRGERTRTFTAECLTTDRFTAESMAQHRRAFFKDPEDERRHLFRIHEFELTEVGTISSFRGMM